MSSYFEPAGPRAGVNGLMMTRFVAQGTLVATNAVAGTYVDFGGIFTTNITTIAGDQVHIVVQSNGKKDVGGAGTVVVDRGGIKLPASGVNSSVYLDASTAPTYVPFTLEYWDAPGAGTFTYKPQLFTSDANTAHAGNGGQCQYIVEIWR